MSVTQVIKTLDTAVTHNTDVDREVLVSGYKYLLGEGDKKEAAKYALAARTYLSGKPGTHGALTSIRSLLLYRFTYNCTQGM